MCGGFFELFLAKDFGASCAEVDKPFLLVIASSWITVLNILVICMAAVLIGAVMGEI